MRECHCGSGRPFETCCAPVLSGAQPAVTAEALMRARYSAYVEHRIDFLGESLHPEHRGDWDRDATERWARNADWVGLEIRAVEAGGAQDAAGTVEFVAAFKQKGQLKRHHEVSRFARADGRWYYVEGDLPKPVTQRNPLKVGRNDPCPCGSGKKHKKCCGSA